MGRKDFMPRMRLKRERGMRWRNLKGKVLRRGPV